MRIAGWERFQGYKKRGPEWMKLHLSLLDQPEYLRLPVVARAVLPALWITAARTSEDGTLPDDLPILAILTHLSQAEIREAVQPLVSAGFVECDNVVAVLATCMSGEQRRERAEERVGEQRESRPVAVAHGPVAAERTACPPPQIPPEQRAEEATKATIRRLQLELGSMLTRLAEHPNSRRMVPEWCREVTSYDGRDGPVKGVADYRMISSIDRLEKSIEDAKWWLAELEKGRVVANGAR